MFVFKYNFIVVLTGFPWLNQQLCSMGSFCLIDLCMWKWWVPIYHFNSPTSNFICFLLCYRSFKLCINHIMNFFAIRMTSLSLMKTTVHMTVKHHSYHVSKVVIRSNTDYSFSVLLYAKQNCFCACIPSCPPFGVVLELVCHNWLERLRR